MVRVPFLGGLIQHVVEDSWRSGIHFSQLLNVLKVNLKIFLCFYLTSPGYFKKYMLASAFAFVLFCFQITNG